MELRIILTYEVSTRANGLDKSSKSKKINYSNTELKCKCTQNKSSKLSIEIIVSNKRLFSPMKNLKCRRFSKKLNYANHESPDQSTKKKSRQNLGYKQKSELSLNCL